MDKKITVIMIAFLFLISVSANLYSFNKLSNEESEINKKNALVLSSKENEVNELKEQIEILESKEVNSKTEKSEEGQEGIDEVTEQLEVSNVSELENAAERFVDYSFNVNEENYALVKANADNYMTDEMVETLFSSDGISEEDMKLKTTVDQIDVFTSNVDENQAIVHYEIKLDYGNGYEENLKPFVLLHFVTENGKIKVSKLQAINDIGGI